MKTTSLIIGLIVAVAIAMFSIFYFIQPVLILTLKDVCILILFDAIAAFLLALYLSDDNKNKLIMWTIIGVMILIVPIIASVIKYNKSKAKA